MLCAAKTKNLKTNKQMHTPKVASVPAQNIHYAAAAIWLREDEFGGSDAARKEEKFLDAYYNR